MDNATVGKWIKGAKQESLRIGRSWLMSDGKELKVITTKKMGEYYRNAEGFWVAAIYENGNKVEA